MKNNCKLRNEVREFKKQKVYDALQATRGNVTHAADMLGINRPNIYPTMRHLGIDVNELRMKAGFHV